MASVRKLDPKDPKSKWVVEYTGRDGKRHRKTPKSGLKKDADTIARKIEREMEVGTHTPGSATVTMRELCFEYGKHMDDRHKDGAIGKTYLINVHGGIKVAILPALGAIRVADLKSADVERMVSSMRDAGRAPKTIKLRLDSLYEIIEFGKRRGYTAVNPVMAVQRARRGILPKPICTFTKEQVRAVLAALEERPVKARSEALAHRRLCVHIAAFCGLRVGEILALMPESIDFRARIIRVRASKTRLNEMKGPKTAAGNRDVPMPSHVADMIAEWLRTYYLPDRGLTLLHGEKGRQLDYANFSRRWQKLLVRAGVKPCPKEGFHHFHALRHFAGSLMIEQGYSVVEVANILGHKHFDVTLQVYVHALAGGSHHVEMAERMASDFMAAKTTRGPLMIEGTAT